MTTLMQASAQWASRPAEERFTSLLAMHATMDERRRASHALVKPSRNLAAAPTDDGRGLQVLSLDDNGNVRGISTPTHWSFGQLASLVGAPAGYLRDLPPAVASDCLNFGLRVARDAQDVGVLVRRDDEGLTLRACTGPRYGRIWNADVVGALIERFGDGRTGDFRVPGEFGREVEVTKANTTLYAGDRDMFVFLADEKNRITLPGRRNGREGTLARGFFVWNSEEGNSTFGVKTFLFDYVCQNRIVWGAHELEEIRIRHTASAPGRFIEEVAPALELYAQATESSTLRVIEDARKARVESDLDKFLATRFGPRVGERIKAAHVADEGRPIETVWDVVTGATAYARSIPWTAERVAMEEQAGSLLDAFV